MKVFYRAGCLVSILAPILGALFYPRANWLFAFMVVGVAILVTAVLTRKDPLPSEVANDAERILTGTSRGHDVDDYEHLNPRGSQLKDLWSQTLLVHPAPEEWIRLDESKKAKLRELICKIRELPREPEK